MEIRLLDYVCFVLTVIYAKEDRTIVKIGKFIYTNIYNVYFMHSSTCFRGSWLWYLKTLSTISLPVLMTTYFNQY